MPTIIRAGALPVEGGNNNGVDISAANASPSQVIKGATFFSGTSESIQTGTLEVPDLSLATAGASHVAAGESFYSSGSNSIQTGTATRINSGTTELQVGYSGSIQGPAFIEGLVQFVATQGYTFNIYGFTGVYGQSSHFITDITYNSSCVYFAYVTPKDKYTTGYYISLAYTNGFLINLYGTNTIDTVVYDVYIFEISSSHLAKISKIELEDGTFG